MRTLYLLIIIVLFSCQSPNSTKTKTSERKEQFRKLDKQIVVGDFDGDGKLDTIYQHNFSKVRKAEIDSFPDFTSTPTDSNLSNDNDTFYNWFYNLESDIYLSFNKPNMDTLHLGTGYGLYCLLNIGDNNLDGNDEIAFVVDWIDMSALNTCKISSLCNNKWKDLEEIRVWEGAFDQTTSTRPNVKEIKGFLEKQKNKWFYKDYLKETELDGMKKLKINKCN